MPQLSDAQLATVLRGAGFTGAALVTAVAVGLGESGGNTDATNRNTNGSVDIGIMQINSVHAKLIAGRNLKDAAVNASLAFQISNGGRNWRPWSAYNNGRYRQFMARATVAAGSPNASVPAGGDTAPAGVSLTDPTSFLTFFTNPGIWARVAAFIAGGVMLLLGLWQMTGIGGNVVNTARKAFA